MTIQNSGSGTTAEQVQKAIDCLQTDIRQHERELVKKKQAVNNLCLAVGQPAIYREEELTLDVCLRDTQFYGLPLADALVQALAARHAAALGPASAAELLDLLVRGGFEFRSANADNQRSSISKALREDDRFHRLPNKTHGLKAWYPNAATAKPRLLEEPAPEPAAEAA